MDIRLPGIDGLEATRRIMSTRPTPIVVIADSVHDATLGIAMNALKAGALTVQEQVDAGKALFAGTCSTCHQPDGKGMEGVFPPLAASDYIKADPKALPRVILHGLVGPVKVNGKDYNSNMPPMSQLTDDEVANISTYVLNSWGNPGGRVTKEEAAAIRAAKPANASDGH